MEWLASILNGGNIIPILIFVALVLIGVYYVIKKGFIRFQAHGLLIGNDKRLLIAELELGRALVDSIPVDNNDFELLHTVEMLYNQIEKWIVVNNITDAEWYVRNKQIIVRSIPNIYKILEDPDLFVNMTIKELVSLKKSWRQ